MYQLSEGGPRSEVARMNEKSKYSSGFTGLFEQIYFTGVSVFVFEMPSTMPG